MAGRPAIIGPDAILSSVEKGASRQPETRIISTGCEGEVKRETDAVVLHSEMCCPRNGVHATRPRPLPCQPDTGLDRPWNPLIAQQPLRLPTPCRWRKILFIDVRGRTS